MSGLVWWSSHIKPPTVPVREMATPHPIGLILVNLFQEKRQSKVGCSYLRSRQIGWTSFPWKTSVRSSISPRPCPGNDDNQHTVAAHLGCWWELLIDGSSAQKIGHTSLYGLPQICRQRVPQQWWKQTPPRSIGKRTHLRGSVQNQDSLDG